MTDAMEDPATQTVTSERTAPPSREERRAAKRAALARELREIRAERAAKREQKQLRKLAKKGVMPEPQEPSEGSVDAQVLEPEADGAAPTPVDSAAEKTRVKEEKVEAKRRAKEAKRLERETAKAARRDAKAPAPEPIPPTDGDAVLDPMPSSEGTLPAEAPGSQPPTTALEEPTGSTSRQRRK